MDAVITYVDGNDPLWRKSFAEAVGIDVLDSSGNVRDMTEIMDELGSKWDTLSKKDRLALGEAIAGRI